MRNFILILLMLGSFQLYCQSRNDTIRLEENPKLNFFQHGNKLKQSQVSDILKNNSMAQNEFVIAQLNYYLGYGLESVGAIAMGYSIIRLLIYKEPMNWEVFGAGAAAYIVSYPLINGYKKRSKSAVSIYNNSLDNTSFNKLYWQFGLNSSGVGLTIYL